MPIHGITRFAAWLATTLLLTGSLAACSSGQPEDQLTRGAAATETAQAPETVEATGSATSSPEEQESSNTGGASDLVPLVDEVSQPVVPGMTKDDAGALEFMYYSLDAVNWAYATADASALPEIYDSAASHLANVTQGVDYLANNGLIQYGGLAYFEVGNLVVSWPSENTATINISLTYEPGEVRRPDGTVTDVSDGGRRDLEYQLEWREDRWVILDATLA